MTNSQLKNQDKMYYGNQLTYMIRRPFGIVLILGLYLMGSCADKKEIPATLFTLIEPEVSGITFQNTLTETKHDNHLLNEKFVNGAGVAIGDINNDGLPDIYFAGNQTYDRLYLNKGNLKFEDVTTKSGILMERTWSTGVTFADVNADGHLDIYVCKSARGEFDRGTNLLYMNNGDLTFTQAAGLFNLDDRGFSVQANFFDYDKDGLVDMYLINQPPSYGNRAGGINPLGRPNPLYSDKLYKNIGKKGFVEVSAGAGTENLAHGLSASVGDLNNDNWLDIYVTNDYDRPDFMYVNNKDGSYSEGLQSAFKHISNFSMGSDVADFDNDGNLDIMVVDMVAEDHERIKTNMSGMNPEDFWAIVDQGGHYQYMFNTLQRNNGNGSFSDVAQLSGVSNTDWSWGPLFADFDNDGHKDLFVTNGIKRNMRYTDVNNEYELILDSLEVIAKKENKKFQEVVNVLELAQMAPEDKLTNYIYRNRGDLTFDKKIEDWGMNQVSLSNGAAYADLDLDGDLDLVINNIDEPAFLYRNNAVQKETGNYLQVKLKTSGNTSVYGTRIKLFNEHGLWQMIELSNTRGYMSKSTDIAHFGLGKANKIKRLEVLWNDGTSTEQTNLAANQLLEISKEANTGKNKVSKENNKNILFEEVMDQVGLKFFHTENQYDDYAKEVLLPHKMSQFGPSLAVGDVNGDGLDDFFVGGPAGISGTLFLQTNDGKFEEDSQSPWKSDKASEDMGSLFFDADNDGDLDLYIVSGGNEFAANSPELQDRIYMNNGSGKFQKAPKRLPEFYTSGMAIKAADFDNDGDQDLFIGGRVVPGNYPQPADSKILENQDGYFVDVTPERAPVLEKLGLVSSVAWTDVNQDKLLDLVIVGEWMPITILLQNNEGIFEPNQLSGLEESHGWYYKVISADMDNDGDQDLIVGNLGLNYKYKASEEMPFELYSADFDENGQNDIVLSYHEEGSLFPVRGRSCSVQQIPSLAEKFPTFAAFGKANVGDIYGSKLDEALHLQAKTFASFYIENLEGKSFRMHPLPMLAQVSSINNIIAQDFDQDGKLDLLVSGNMYQSEIETPRNDAGVGLFLKGGGNGDFQPQTPSQSGFFAPFDAKDMKKISWKGQEAILVGNNQEKLQFFALRNP